MSDAEPRGMTFNLDPSAYEIVDSFARKLAAETCLPVSIKTVIWASLVTWESGEVPYGILPVNSVTRKLLKEIILGAWEDERCRSLFEDGQSPQQ